MPELPEVETVKNTLKKHILGKEIKEIKVYYPKIIEYPSVKELQAQIKNKKIIDIDRLGKWIIFNLGDYYLLSHLRMEGKYFYKTENDPILKHEHISIIFKDGLDLRYKDTRKFGRMYFVKKDELFQHTPLSKLGFEPWDDKLDIKYLKDKYKNKSLPIKTVLLDQSIIAGIGNIYADEILFLSKINPHKEAKSLRNKELNEIIVNTRKVLEEAIKEGGTTIRSYTSEEGVTGLFQNNLLVHKREKEKCKVCGNLIIREKINTRSTYYCPKCQR
ncbi:MAG TPA: DNA-formamidopyrimidine glycosylase [Bacilli bacterium]|nr:DNA-formamidopyrimidine glycosylase [Bacilli bacterium]